jgi:predicted ATPase
VLGLGDRLPRPTLQRLYTISAGNPFFALEIARALQRGRSNGPEPLAVPDSLHSLVRDRLDALGPATQRALFAASALSRPTVDHVMQALGGVRGGLRALERAADAQVIELDAGSIAFTHPLLASAIYASRSPTQRRRLHRALSEVVTDAEERVATLRSHPFVRTPRSRLSWNEPATGPCVAAPPTQRRSSTNKRSA